jgi:hypothetical protein
MANQVLYGFWNYTDLFNRRVTEVGVSVVNTAITETMNEHNRQVNALRALFARPTTDHKTRFRSVVAARLQPLDRNGRALPIKPAGKYDVGYPLQFAGTAWGWDYVTYQKMRLEDVNETLYTLITADHRWMRDHILAALFDNTNGGWTFTDEEHGTLQIMGLANGDTTPYAILSGSDQPTTADHYLAQAAAISDAANPFPTIYSTLTNRPENSGEVIVLVPTNLMTTIEALADYKEAPDPNIREGVNTALLVGNLGAAVPGTVRGYVNKCWIVEWRSLPDNYMVALTTGGERALAMRQDVEAVLRGFHRVAQREDHPFYEQQYIRRAGFGAWNRVGALVYRVGNAAYAIPTGYANPIV